MIKKIWLSLAAVLAIFLLAAPAQAQSTRSQLTTNYLNPCVVANTTGLISQSCAYTLFQNEIQSFGTLADTNAWTGLNTFADSGSWSSSGIGNAKALGVGETAPSAGNVNIAGQYQIGGSPLNFSNLAGNVTTSQGGLYGATLNAIPYGGGAGTLPSFIAAVNNAVLATNGSGVPSEVTTLPSGLTIPTPTISGTANASVINMLANGAAAGSGPIYIQNITGYTNGAGGQNGGLRIINSNDGGLSNNPGAGGAVSLSVFVDNTYGRGSTGQLLFSAFNADCDQQPTTASPAGSFSTNDCIESDVSRSIGGALTNPWGAPQAFAYYASAQLNGSSNPQQPNEGYLALSANSTAKTDWFGYGFVASRIAITGYFCGDYPADSLHGFGSACFQDTSQSPASLLISGTHTSAIDTSGATLTNLVNGSAGVLSYPHSNLGLGDAFYIGKSTSGSAGIEIGVGGSGNTTGYISTDGGSYFQMATNGAVPVLLGYNNAEKMRINGSVIELEQTVDFHYAGTTTCTVTGSIAVQINGSAHQIPYC